MSFTLVSRYGFYSALLAITVLALIPAQEVTITTGWDKANHCLAFAVLLSLLDSAYPKLAMLSTKLVILIAYGVLIEVVQAFLPGRFFSLWDIAADLIGLSLYLIVRPVILRHLPST